jgi:catalase
LFDALVLPDGQAGVDALAMDGHTMEFIKDQYRHCKTILVLGASTALLSKAGVPSTLPDGKPDTGLIIASSGDAANAADMFIKGIALHRHVLRETDPPRV